MRKSKQDHHEGIDFWQPSSDLMTALLLILALVIALLLLFLIHVPEDVDYDDYNAKSYETEGDGKDVDDIYHEDHTQDYEETHQNSTGGGGGNGGEGDDDGDEPEEYPEGEPGSKSAVYVMLVDGETEKTIPEKGVGFDLHSERGAIEILNTYYPVKTSYRDYGTTSMGTFYLPEKIPQGGYYFKNLTEATGYELAEDVHFVVDNVYDWPDPFVVTIPVYPARNVISIYLLGEEKQPVAGAGFQITAAEDITTEDGTARYKKGEKVGKIITDKDGHGESKELYLGNYVLTQTAIPEYYANIQEPTDVTLERKNTSKDNTQNLKCEKTKVTIRLEDELSNTPIEGAEFIIANSDSENKYTTNASGEIVLEENKKNDTYTIRQTSTTGDYLIADEPLSIAISDTGRIDGAAKYTKTLTNRMIRVNFDIQDAVLGNALSDISVSLFDSDGTSVKNWTTNGGPQSFTDLSDGNYYVITNGKDSKQYPVSIKNTKDIQTITIRIYTIKSYLTIAAGAGIGIALIYLIIRICKRIAKKRRDKKGENS